MSTGEYEVVLQSVERSSTEKGLRRLFAKEAPASVTLDVASQKAVLRFLSRELADACAKRWDALVAAEGAFARRGRGRAPPPEPAVIRPAPTKAPVPSPQTASGSAAATLAACTGDAAQKAAKRRQQSNAPEGALHKSSKDIHPVSTAEAGATACAAPKAAKRKRHLGTSKEASAPTMPAASDRESEMPAPAAAPSAAAACATPKAKKRRQRPDLLDYALVPTEVVAAKPARPDATKKLHETAADGESLTRAKELTLQINAFAKDRQMRKAVAVFEQMQEEGLPVDVRAYAALANAHVSTGDVAGAERALAAMEASGLEPNVVAYTALLKGYCRIGDINSARSLLEKMVTREKPVLPDQHAVNTFLRGCVRTGDVEAAQEMAERLPAWDIRAEADPGGTCRFLGLLWGQSLRLEPLKAMLALLQQKEDHNISGISGNISHPLINEPCQFWASGKCKKGKKCRFLHDAKIVQRGKGKLEVERLGAVSSLNLSLARACALLGETDQCSAAWKNGCSAHASAAEALKSGGAQVEHLSTSVWKLEQEIELLRHSASASHGRATPNINKFVGRAFIFDQSAPIAARSQDARGGKKRKAKLSRKSEAAAGAAVGVAGSLLSSLERSFGLDQCLRLGIVPQRGDLLQHFRDCFMEDGVRLNWQYIFQQSDVAAGGQRPVKLEICSGSGEWAVEQAKASVDSANWATVEIMRDRVHDCFTRMALSDLPNLCVIGGDAAQVLGHHVLPGSVDHAFVNFPEPPHVSGDEASDSGLHLLTPDFLQSVHDALGLHGRLTILSDNLRYLRCLARSLSELRSPDAKAAFAEAGGCGGEETYEDVEGVRIHYGWPGERQGHHVKATSYFDRLWARSARTERYFIHLVRSDDGP